MGKRKFSTSSCKSNRYAQKEKSSNPTRKKHHKYNIFAQNLIYLHDVAEGK